MKHCFAVERGILTAQQRWKSGGEAVESRSNDEEIIKVTQGIPKFTLPD